jgi:hypothetical protein
MCIFADSLRPLQGSQGAIDKQQAGNSEFKKSRRILKLLFGYHFPIPKVLYSVKQMLKQN